MVPPSVAERLAAVAAAEGALARVR
jgi:hypothetical protein